ncbi:hypothetical protein OF829_17940 [Sphingomonas sp. LB-2]|uniref:hypothetical protein n=1 Tax=Sphingomonas caeni TaxID=2984949 RepID=UPI0022308E39|nr:hypothetical protein [Sphingomonas caeni]MCW3849125.1 hypothetical protein [Sphingomonas caeni]
MAALLAIGFFAGVLGVSIWSVVDSVRPHLGRIAFLLEHGPVGAPELPRPPRVTLRGRQVPVRMVMPAQFRAAA